MKRRTFAGVLVIIVAIFAMSNPADSKSKKDKSPTSQATTGPIVPVPAIKTSLASMPGVDQLPVREEMPDPLIMDNGQRITNLEQWKARREEIKKELEYYATGLMPPPPGNVTGKEITSKDLEGGTVHYQLVHLTFGPGEKLGFDIAIFTPKGPGPFPVIIVPGGTPPGATPLKTMFRPAQQGKGLDAMTIPLGVPTTAPATQPSTRPATKPSYREGSGVGLFGTAPATPEQSAKANGDLFKRGYALITYNNQDCGEDTIARNLDGSWAFRNSRFFRLIRGMTGACWRAGRGDFRGWWIMCRRTRSLTRAR